MTLRITSEVRIERGAAVGSAGIDELDESDEPQASSILDESHSEVAVKVAADSARVNAQTPSQRRLRGIGRSAERLERLAAVHVRFGRAIDGEREKIRQALIARSRVTDMSQAGKLGMNAGELRARKPCMLDGRATSPAQGLLHEFWPERYDEQVEIVARIEENVVLTRLEEEQLSR
jgi:hypothetical protein